MKAFHPLTTTGLAPLVLLLILNIKVFYLKNINKVTKKYSRKISTKVTKKDSRKISTKVTERDSRKISTKVSNYN